MVKKAALSEAGSLADVLDSRCRIALGANHIEGGIQKSSAGIVMY
jgi:hypothetical protein